ncbi:MAG TPA: hypothetical protein VKU19_04360 [Bryobacteraceae bacterium]|nr:hypothetical protein [Bryobacteraceae bacterium]
MDFYKRYELIEPLAGPGTKSFRAKQASTQRDVTVHLLIGGRTPENEQLLARLRAMPAQSFSKLIEVGDNDGTPYVVTVAPPYQHLAEWLTDQETAAAQSAQRFTHAGAFRAPVAPPDITGASPSPRRDPATQPAPPRKPSSGMWVPPQQDLPEMPTRPSLASMAPPTPVAPAPPVSPAAPSVMPGAQEPGEFTKMFQRGPSPAADPPPQARAPEMPAKPPSYSGPPPSSAPEPGEFTKVFQSGARPVSDSSRPAPSAPSAPSAGEPGEFTRMFQSAGRADAPIVQEPPRAPAKPPSQSAPPPQVARPVQPIPPSQPVTAPQEEPGEFTRLFQKGQGLPAQKPVSTQGADTISFQVPMVPLPPEKGAPTEPMARPDSVSEATEPGEFTRMFQKGPEPAPPSFPAATPPSVGTGKPPSQPTAGEPGEFTQLFGPTARPPQRPVQPLETMQNPVYGAPAKPPTPPSTVPKPITQSPAPPAPKPAAPGPPREEGPGEFTQMFGASARPPQRPAQPLETMQNPAFGTTAAAKPPVRPTAPAESAGEFTKAFGNPADLQTMEGQAYLATPKAPASSPAPVAGEFTKEFGRSPIESLQTSQNPAYGAPKPPSQALPPSPPRSTPPVASFQGEFSGMFQEPPRPVSSSPAKPGSPSQGPGEFTQMFNSPLPDKPEPQEEWAKKQSKPAPNPGFRPTVPPAGGDRSREQEDKSQGEFTRFFRPPGASGQPPQPMPSGPSFQSSPVGAMPQTQQPQPLATPRAPQPSPSAPGEFTRMFGRPTQDPQAAPMSGGSSSSGATGMFANPLPAAGPGQTAANNPFLPQPPVPQPAPVAAPAAPEPQGPSEWTMMIDRQKLQAAGGGAPAAAPQAGGGSPVQLQVSPQGAYLPGVYPPRLPNIPTPQANIGGVHVQGPYVPTPQLPTPSIPQVGIPGATATVTTKGSSTLIERIIFFLLGMLVGAGLVLLLKK